MKNRASPAAFYTPFTAIFQRNACPDMPTGSELIYASIEVLKPRSMSSRAHLCQTVVGVS